MKLLPYFVYEVIQLLCQILRHTLLWTRGGSRRRLSLRRRAADELETQDIKRHKTSKRVTFSSRDKHNPSSQWHVNEHCLSCYLGPHCALVPPSHLDNRAFFLLGSTILIPFWAPNATFVTKIFLCIRRCGVNKSVSQMQSS